MTRDEMLLLFESLKERKHELEFQFRDYGTEYDAEEMAEIDAVLQDLRIDLGIKGPCCDPSNNWKKSCDECREWWIDECVERGRESDCHCYD